MSKVMSRVMNILDNLQGWYGPSYSEALGRSLSRVQKHSQERSIGIISANRADHTPAENNEARHALSKDVKSMGYGYTHVRGVGQEEGGASHEPSLLVIGNKGDDKGKLKKDMTKLGQKYGQMGVLHKQHGDANAKFVHTSKDHAGKEEDLGKFHANNSAAKYYTKLKGDRKVSFENVVYLEPQGFFVRRDMFYDGHD